MTAPVVSVREVSKRYGDVLAVDAVTLDVRAGEVYALLGLNGAGKTTLIRVLLGMVRAGAGEVRIDGRPLTDRTVWSQVGYLVESPTAYPELTVRENLEVARRLRKLADPAAVDRAIELLGLRPYADRQARKLSLGNAQRLGLAKALLHGPRLLVLDEPVNGLDPAGVAEVRELVVHLAHEQGVTVLLSSHLLGEVARTADRIGVLHQGRLVDEFDAGELAVRVHRRLEVDVHDPHRAAEALRAAGLRPSSCDDGGLVLDDPDTVRHPERVATALVQAGAPPTRLQVAEEDLESYFLRLVSPAAPHGAGAPTPRRLSGVC